MTTPSRPEPWATPFTRLVGCRLPLQLAGMGGVSTVALASAVSEAGGLGMLNVSVLGPDELDAALEAMATATAAPWGVNVIVPFLDDAVVERCARRAPLLEFFYGDPDSAVVARAGGGGALVAWQVGSADEARAAVDAGCDLVVAQGVEAGGHVRGTVGLLPLLDSVLDAVSVPVVAAGGIGTGRAAAGAFAAGAHAVRVGTRFVASEESGAHPDYVAALVAAGPADTVLTEAFATFWPDAPHRVLRRCVDELARVEGDTVGEASVGGLRVPLPKGAAPTPARDTTGNIAAMPHYAGQSVGAVHAVQPARAIVEELMSEARRVLAEAAGPA